jgi:CubicO group peptidase (beta-lactamase class C family)
VTRGRLLVALALVGLAAVTAAIAWPSREPEFREPRDLADLASRVDRAVRAARDDEVPQVAVAIVHRGRVAWTRGYGGATAATPFQVGSISKPVAALGLLRLARARGISLDAQLSPRGWRTRRGVTLRRLLSHTAGLSVGGYQGLDPARPLPSTLDELQGRGEGPPVVAEDAPGERLRYSGGGYTVAQLWAEQTSGRPFAAFMRTTALGPLGMARSTFAQTRPAGAAAGNDADGDPIPSYRYAALAAAGLWSTADDIGRFLAFTVSDDPLARAMRRPAPGTGGAWGLGLEVQELPGGRTLIEHDGVNRGWHARIAAEPSSGWGVAVLTNSDVGGKVADAATAELLSG